MSDLQKAWAKNRISGLPIEAFDEREEEEERESGTVPELPDHFDDDSSSASSASSTGTIIPSPSQNLFARPQGAPRGRTLQPIPWTTYFERELFLSDEDGSEPGSPTIHAYLTSPVDKGPLFVMHHGGGSSGLSFAVVGHEIRKRLPTAGILSVDARGHGATTVPSSSPSDSESGGAVDLSLATLAADLRLAIQRTQRAMRWARLPPVVLVGHSMGGAVVVELARSGALDPAPLLGYAVLDVVEGSAIDALQSMHTYLQTRPAGFASLEAAVDWHLRSRTLRNAVSARTSVPGLVVDNNNNNNNNNNAAPTPTPTPASSTTTTTPTTTTTTTTATTTAHQEPPQQQKPEDAAPPARRPDARPWKWRADLAATQPFWEDWFVGLSRKFLTARGGKLLLLAGTDRLDTELTIGQMQGKYALQVFPEAGHFIHEDLPEKTAVALVDFHRRNDRSALVLPPKVSDLLRQGKKV